MVRDEAGIDGRTLLDRVINDKDRWAFESLYTLYYQRLCLYITRRVGTPADAEDIAQSVFLRLWETRARYRKGGSAEAYLLTMVHNAIAQHIRRKKPRGYVPLERVAENMVDPRMCGGPETCGSAARREVRDILMRNTAQLSSKAAEAVRLRFVRGLSPVQAASLAGCSVAAFYSRLERALKGLRQAYARNEHGE